MGRTDRIVVIGGGITGAGAAYELARSGTPVTLVDATHTGQATSAGAGIVCPALTRTHSPAWYPLAFAAVDAYRPLIDSLAADGQTDTGYETVGELFMAWDADERAQLDELAVLVEKRRDEGVANVGEVHLLDSDGARDLFPPLAESAGALHVSGAARVDGRRLRDALRRATVARGGEIRRGSAELIGTDSRITGVRIDGEEVPADAVVLAAGAWTDPLLRGWGRRLGIEPQRGQITHLDLPDVDTAGLPIIQDFGSHYMLAFPAGRVVVGATREHGAGFDYRVTATGQHEVLHEALRVAPGLAGATLVETRIGFRPASPDGLAVLGGLDGLAGLVLATGLGPSGLTVGPYLGALAGRLAVGEEPELDLTPYRPDRLG